MKIALSILAYTVSGFIAIATMSENAMAIPTLTSIGGHFKKWTSVKTPSSFDRGGGRSTTLVDNVPKGIENMPILEVNTRSTLQNRPLWTRARSWGILVVGVGVGVLFFGPNVMMSDSGSPKAVAAANLGMAASVLFCIGGVYGFVMDSGWWVLLPGLTCQIACFLAFA